MYILMLAMPTFGLYSCSKDEVNDLDPEKPNVPETPKDPDNPKPEEYVMAPEDQKAYLDEVGKEFIALNSSDDFESISKLAKDVSSKYENYDFSNVEDWAEDIFDGLVKEVDSKEHYYSIYGYRYCDVYTDYTGLIAISNFKGHFTANDARKKWTQSSASDLKFLFTDKNGTACELTLTTSGRTQNVYIGPQFEGWDDDYVYQNGSGIYYEYFKTYDLTFTVPEHINLSLTRGGNTVIKTTVDIDLKNLSSDKFNPARNNLSIKQNTILENGYVIEIKQGDYSPNAFGVQTEVRKNEKLLFSATASSKLSNIPSFNMDDFINDPEAYNYDNTNAKEMYVKLDILGKVQVIGYLPDLRKYTDTADKAYEAEQNGDLYKLYIEELNSLSQINMYFNNGSSKQASLVLEPLYQKEYSYNYWTTEAVIKFDDGSMYSVEQFFDEDYFNNLVKRFEKLLNDYEYMVEK